MGYDSVRDYLESQKRGRPQTLKEISLSVRKSEFSTLRELNGLILRGEVRTVVLQFNGKDVPFYTLRRDTSVRVIKHASQQHDWQI